MSLYNILDEAIGFQKKLERDTHDRLNRKKFKLPKFRK
jgi:hypothetical protein